MSPAAAGLFLPDDRLSLPELRAAVLDGELAPLGDAFQPIDAPATALARACALHGALGDPRIVIAGRSAAWVWGWGPQPSAVTAVVSIAARIPSPERRRLRASEVVIDENEQRRLGGARVTTPLRTVVDLSRHEPQESVVELLATAIRSEGFSAAALDQELARRPGLPFVRRARRRIEAALSRC